MKEQIFQKLTSRKFWVAIVGIVVGIAAAFGIDENDYAQMVGLIGAIASALSYVFAEASVDKAATETPALTDETSAKGDVNNG